MKRRLLVYSIFALIIFVFVLGETYGLFETNASANTNFSVGKWVILLNNEDISLEEDISLSDFIYEANSHVESGYFAPGTSAYLDVLIDATGTDVSFVYAISLDRSNLATHPNIRLTFTDSNNNVINDSNYTGEILVTDQNRTLSFRINLIWEENSTYNVYDTELIDSDMSFPLSLTFSQLISSQ